MSLRGVTAIVFCSFVLLTGTVLGGCGSGAGPSGNGGESSGKPALLFFWEPG